MRTFAEQVKHVAAVNYMVAAVVLNEKPPLDLGKGENGPDGIQGKDAILSGPAGGIVVDPRPSQSLIVPGKMWVASGSTYVSTVSPLARSGREALQFLIVPCVCRHDTTEADARHMHARDRAPHELPERALTIQSLESRTSWIVASLSVVVLATSFGALWITQSNDPRDIVIKGGESFVLDRPGLALVCAAAGPAVVAVDVPRHELPALPPYRWDMRNAARDRTVAGL